MFDPTSSAAVHAPRFMRLAARLALAALGLAFAPPVRAGWTVNATGDCVETWVAPPAAQGPVAMLNALALPVRSAVGGGQVAAAGDQSGHATLALTVLSWPALVVAGFGIGVVEMPIWLVTGLADTVTLGSLDLVPDAAKALTLASVRPRFLPETGTTPESCAGRR
jgi:hypothetical protein